MTVLQFLAVAGLVVCGLYNIAFYAEGCETQGSIGLKTLGAAFDSLILAVMVWVAFFS